MQRKPSARPPTIFATFMSINHQKMKSNFNMEITVLKLPTETTFLQQISIEFSYHFQCLEWECDDIEKSIQGRHGCTRQTEFYPFKAQFVESLCTYEL